MPRQEARRWREWYEADADSVIDAVADPADPWPRRSDLLLQLHSYVRHPRAFLKNTGYDQPQDQVAGS
jgi:hypothetical protein